MVYVVQMAGLMLEEKKTYIRQYAYALRYDNRCLGSPHQHNTPHAAAYVPTTKGARFQLTKYKILACSQLS